MSGLFVNRNYVEGYHDSLYDKPKKGKKVTAQERLEVRKMKYLKTHIERQNRIDRALEDRKSANWSSHQKFLAEQIAMNNSVRPPLAAEVRDLRVIHGSREQEFARVLNAWAHLTTARPEEFFLP